MINKLKKKYHDFMMRKCFDYMNYNGGVIKICADCDGNIKHIELNYLKGVKVITDNSYPSDFDTSQGFITVKECSSFVMSDSYLNADLRVERGMPNHFNSITLNGNLILDQNKDDKQEKEGAI